MLVNKSFLPTPFRAQCYILQSLSFMHQHMLLKSSQTDLTCVLPWFDCNFELLTRRCHNVDRHAASQESEFVQEVLERWGG